MNKTIIQQPELVTPTIVVPEGFGTALAFNWKGQRLFDIEFSDGSVDFVRQFQGELQYNFDGPVLATTFHGSGQFLKNISPNSLVGGITGVFGNLRFHNGVLVEVIS